ncbi:Protein of unknown function [Bacillus cereus]|uniref:Uncharacterized protein n=28 Tax=Bacillus TaxID=1386 RepID=A0AB37YTK2_9BACI|nr:Protein of unknown function [Bacillus wiedmannii]SCC69601.1 Protein of unknown function [Bacillus cereus]SCN41775.1 Protein of unknown function [Bacillus wiedmannii]
MSVSDELQLFAQEI